MDCHNFNNNYIITFPFKSSAENIFLTESDDSFREAAEADPVENISLTDSFVSRVSFMDAIEPIKIEFVYN